MNRKKGVFICILVLGVFFSIPVLASTEKSNVRAYLSNSNQTISTSSWTKAQLNSEEFDTKDEFDSSTNYRFVATEEGYYQVNGSARIANLGDAKSLGIAFYKNGSDYSSTIVNSGTAGSRSVVLSDVIYLDVDDYIELYVFHAQGIDRDLDAFQQRTFLSISQITNEGDNTIVVEDLNLLIRTLTWALGIIIFILVIKLFLCR